MHILLTRPLDDCKDLILKFKSLGHNVSHFPVIKVEKLDFKEIDFNSSKAIIFTSANAIKHLNVKNINKHIYCFCVGEATERLAKQAGFQNIYCAEGNVKNLQEIILQNFDKNHGSMIYISGEKISYNLDKNLANLGYSIKRLINYTVTPIFDLDHSFVEQLKASIPDIVFIYSENSARSYLNLLKKYDLIDSWMNTNLMCLGEKSSSILNEIKWKKIFLFNSGEEEYLLYKI